MLEVKNLSKIYKSKNGVDVKALDDVSLRFPEKGMVFLLGKSGSGKSTLLNVCGGLDAPTDGEIIVKGRSSKDFSQSDFDSYRNTFVGFIFQEYNILNEFSVEDNIALALELQGKPKDKNAVADLLKQVDLEGFAKRKPNTLSGGQKQRIAIARALVKSPEIIMADEPTGALDSTTGKQVFETLKKLSKDKLVLVVSHDRDFAEQYGDRIVELQDGRVISDVTKTQEPQREVSGNINATGDVLCIKQGAELDEKDFAAIKAFLRKSSSDIIIAGNEKDVKDIKKACRITDEGEKEVFLDTKEEVFEKKAYKPEDSRFIRSRLPVKHAVRIGLSSLKSKPIRLFFTIILCTVAFALFGLLSTMSFYDSEAMFKETMYASKYSLLPLEKKYQAKQIVYNNGKKSYEYDKVYEALFSQAEMDELKSIYGTDVFGGVPVSMGYNIGSSVASYWMNSIQTFAYLPEGNSLRSNINGSYPSTKDEICISSYMADVIINCKTYDKDGNVVDVSSHDELIGKVIPISGVNYKIVGIMDSGMISDKYDVLKSAEEDNEKLVYQLAMELQDGLHLAVFVNEERAKTIAAENVYNTGDDWSWNRSIAAVMKNADGKYVYPEWSNAFYESFSDVSEGSIIVYTNGTKTTLTDNEMIVSSKLFAQMVEELYYEKMDAITEVGPSYDQLLAVLQIANDVWNGGEWKEISGTNKTELVTYSDEELSEKINQLLKAVYADGLDISVGAKLFNNDTQTVYGSEKELTIVGIIVNSASNTYMGRVIVSDDIFEQWWDEQKVSINYYSVIETDYEDEYGAIYGNIFVPYDHSEAQTESFWQMYSNDEYSEDGSRIIPGGVFLDNLYLIDDTVQDLSRLFLYVGTILAVFAALLLSNFISVSISQKKKEIGILRAVGARSLDVFKIFFSESFVIAVICVILAIIGSVVTCNVLNELVASKLGIVLFVFGRESFVVLTVIAFVTTVLATFLPVWNAAKKKPVDSIRAL